MSASPPNQVPSELAMVPKSFVVRHVYAPPPAKNNLPFVFVGAVALTLAVFLVLPLTQMVSARREAVLAVRPAELSQVEEPPDVDVPPPPPKQVEQPVEPPPSLDESPPPLNLSVSLDVAFGSGGALAVGSGLLQETTAQGNKLEAFSIIDLDKSPEVITAVPPVYPEGLRKARVEGHVILVFVLDANGKVENPRVESSSHREFERPALDAIHKWKFKPGYKDGKPVRAYLRQPIRFRLPPSS